MPDKSISTPIIFEPMEMNELNRVMAIERVSFSSPWSKTMFVSELFDNPFSLSYVAREEAGREIVGYVVFWVIFDELHLLNVAVDPAWRRHGIGERLVRFLLQIAQKRGVRKGTLEVRASNLPAQQLYRKFGFREVGIRRNYYQGPAEHALLFQCDIDLCPVSSEAGGASGISVKF
jgi:[ribosomal protein S18]-alanine N-acetyltransferase